MAEGELAVMMVAVSMDAVSGVYPLFLDHPVRWFNHSDGFTQAILAGFIALLTIGNAVIACQPYPTCANERIRLSKIDRVKR